jgi:hypothetical protein
VCYLFNHTYNHTLGAVPLQLLLGITVDISVLLRFYFWQRVYYKLSESHFPSESREGIGHIVGISEHVGNALTWKILTEDTHKVLYRSQVRPYSPSDPNLRPSNFDSLRGEIDDPVIKSRHPNLSKYDSGAEIPSGDPPNVFSPEDLVGRTFLMDKQDNGDRYRARIVELIEEHDEDLEKETPRLKYKLSVNNDQFEEIMTYNQIVDFLNCEDNNDDKVWKFKRIVAHQGPLSSNHPDYNGSLYNLQIEWENGEITTEPLGIIAADDPVTCAIYAREKGLLDQPGWKRFKGIARREKKYLRMVNQAKLRSYNTAPRYKYGHEVPRDYKHAMRLDERNGNKRWQEAIDLELSQIDEYETFEDKGKSPPPAGYKKIRVHLVFDVKPSGKHKARLVADGHLTEVPLESVYSGVVSLRGIRMVAFLAELNGHQLWATDVGNAYLESYTKEKVYIIGGTEFGDREGHVLVVRKALYGLRTSGARWHDRFADCLSEMGFFPCKAEPDIWIRRTGDLYEYVATWVDDLTLALRDPDEFINTLTGKYKFKLKGTGPITFHLGMDFIRDPKGMLCIKPKKYIERMLANYERIFGEKPKKSYYSPLDKGDHPELDDSELLDETGIKTYQSLIGALQWVVSIGRFDVQTALMTLSSFRTLPRRGHLDRVKRIYGYLRNMDDACIRIRTEEPDYSDLPHFEFDWSRSVYGDAKEQVPKDAPEPLGKYVTLTHYVDANLMHDMVTGRSVTGIIHLLNQTPIDFYSKKQATVETATYGSEFVAARTCVEQIIDLRNTLRYLGVPIRDKSYMFGDNKSVTDSASRIDAKLHKRHTMLSFHRVREAIASGMVVFNHIKGALNPADILSKHWGHADVLPQLQSLLYWYGDTADIKDKREK